MGFLGVLIILRPGIEAFQPAALGVLAASLGYAVSNIGTKKLIPVQSTIAILFWMNLMQAVMALVGIDLAFPLRLGAHDWIWAIGIAVGGTAAHYCLTNALRVADAIVVIPLDFLRIPLIAFVGWMFYGETLDCWCSSAAESSCRESCGTCAPRCAEAQSRREYRIPTAYRAAAQRVQALDASVRFTFSTPFARSSRRGREHGCHDAFARSEPLRRVRCLRRDARMPQQAQRSPGRPARRAPAARTELQSQSATPRRPACRDRPRRERDPARAEQTAPLRGGSSRQQAELDRMVGAEAARQGCESSGFFLFGGGNRSRSNASTSTGRSRACAAISTASTVDLQRLRGGDSTAASSAAP
jgi:uncharacterized membrane protein